MLKEPSSKRLEVLLPARAQSSYPLLIATDLLENLVPWLAKNTSTLVIICDHQVEKLYGLSLEQRLKKAGYTTLLLSFIAGEASKNRETKALLEEKMLTAGCDRSTVILALGGGVSGDLAGFIAATYLRGIAYLQLPTTLLAMVDSSVGGKTGLDTPQGKNLIGAFWQPFAVLMDLNCLKTLPQNHLINGLIEALKIFLTCDQQSLCYFDEHLEALLAYDEACLKDIIYRALKLKGSIVAADEREQGQRALLNFGHTIGHAIEFLSSYQLLHGYAVALGILVEAKLAESLGLLSAKNYDFIENILQKMGIFKADLKVFSLQELLKAMQADKKKRAGHVHYVLLKDLGQAYIAEGNFTHPLSEQQVAKVFLELIKD